MVYILTKICVFKKYRSLKGNPFSRSPVGTFVIANSMDPDQANRMSGSKPFDTLKVFLKENLILKKKSQQMTNIIGVKIDNYTKK